MSSQAGFGCARRRARVLAAIEELDYRPNLVARSLAQGRSYVLALLLTDIANPFYAELSRDVENIAQEHGYRLLVCDTAYNVGAGREYLHDLAGRRVDGLLAMGGSLDSQGIRANGLQGPRIVLCNWEEDADFLRLARRGAMPPAVGLDFAYGGALAAHHLVEQGHRRIGVIVHGAGPGRINHISRLTGFRTALAAESVTLDDADVYYGDSTIESGYTAMTALLRTQRRPSGVFATNDLMAIGALNAAYDLGQRVPDDLAVVGFDNISMAAHVRPALTTVGVAPRALATEAMELLLRQVDGADRQGQRPYHLSLRPSLIVRRSSGGQSAPIRDPDGDGHKDDDGARPPVSGGA